MPLRARAAGRSGSWLPPQGEATGTWSRPQVLFRKHTASLVLEVSLVTWVRRPSHLRAADQCLRPQPQSVQGGAYSGCLPGSALSWGGLSLAGRGQVSSKQG